MLSYMYINKEIIKSFVFSEY
ncbi:TPA: TetR/AcrR family transcriptional regulator, partial [Streptococcus agalactiae]